MATNRGLSISLSRGEEPWILEVIRAEFKLYDAAELSGSSHQVPLPQLLCASASPSTFELVM
jgi:hypothetical protein